MGDIDFDELDKAVNSLMSSSDAPSNQKTVPASKRTPQAAPAQRRNTSALQRTATVKPVAKTMDVRPTSPAKVASVSTPPKRSGRFMDVVDSSAELNPIRKPLTAPIRETPRNVFGQSDPKPEAQAESTAVKPAPVSFMAETENRSDGLAESASEPVQVRLVPKSAPTPEPLQLVEDMPLTQNDIADNTTENDDVRPAVVFGPSTEPLVTPTSETATDDMTSVSLVIPPEIALDPLQLQNEQPNASQSLDEVVKMGNGPIMVDYTDSGSAVDTTANSTNKPEEVTPPEIESPFLVDPKVEKRPLSANLAELNEMVTRVGTLQEGENDVSASLDRSFDNQVPTIPDEQMEPSKVPELSTELVAIEATGRAEYELDEPPVPIKSSTDGSRKNEQPKPVTGPTSISQQYESKESSSDASHAPIYDASEYTEPVAHPAKKKSGWLWVLVIFIILAVASGGAVVLYLMGIIP